MESTKEIIHAGVKVKTVSCFIVDSCPAFVDVTADGEHLIWITLFMLQIDQT